MSKGNPAERLEDELDRAKARAFGSVTMSSKESVSYTHLRAHETGRNLVCRLLLEKKK